MYHHLSWLLLAFLCSFVNAEAQQLVDLSEPTDYEIGGIKVIGAEHSDAKAIVTISGLEVGDKIRIPSEATNQAIKKLWQLQLFTDVQISVAKTVKEVVFLEILVEEQTRYFGHTISGVKKVDAEMLDQSIRQIIKDGSVLTAHKLQQVENEIRDFYIEKGYFDATINISQTTDNESDKKIKLAIQIDKKERTKVHQIQIVGHQQLTEKQLKKAISNTKEQNKLLATSKFIPELWETDKRALVALYHRHGYRDAVINNEQIERNAEGHLIIKLTIEEGQQYFFGKINWHGNSKYSDAQLSRNLDIQTGDIYNPMLLNERLNYSDDGTDISSLYLDAGHLFFQIEVVEEALRGNVIDLEIRLQEGTIATIDKVTISGNQVTDEAVIRRELRTQPGEQFSRDAIIRSQRELMNLGYFNPEKLGVDTQVNPERGTVDIEYSVEEKQGDKLELAGGWGGSDIGVTGTVGVSMNNFSLKKLFRFREWQGLPRGDGQQLSFRVQSNGAAYQSYNFSFTEPWLGGKKPNALTAAVYHNRYLNEDEEFGTEQLRLTGASLRYGTRLRFPDDYFTYSASLNFTHYNLSNWQNGLFRLDDGTIVTDGDFYNFNITQQIARSTLNHPLFPTSGWRFALTLKLTPPYSLFNKNDEPTENQTIAEQYKLLEYHKWQFETEYYKSIVGDLVFKAAFKIGYLGSYNSTLGTSPFERFQLGGDGFTGQGVGFQGTDIIALRGYEVEDLENNLIDDQVTATAMFQKITAELRYPFLKRDGMLAYGIGFLEAGNAFSGWKDYQPFDLQRSAGLGLRVFLPMFGTLGFDYGWGFDKNLPEGSKGGYGKFSIILGQEPR